MIALHYKRKDLIKIIKLRKRKDHEKLFLECTQLLGDIVGYLQRYGNKDFDETYADFMSCATTNECDDLLKIKKQANKHRGKQT